MAHEEISEDAVYSCTGNPLPKDIGQIVEWMLNENFTVAYNSRSSSCDMYLTYM